MSAAIELVGVHKYFDDRCVLRDVHARVGAGSLTVLTGPSGSGKTTLLNIASGLTQADDGSVLVAGADLTVMTDHQRRLERARQGHVFQRSGLLGGLSVRENIVVPHLVSGQCTNTAWIDLLLDELELSDVADAPATRISTGQAQRAALLRALAHRPRLVYADEPTASLDTKAKHVVHALLRRLVEDEDLTVLLVSHDQVSLPYATHRIDLVDGRVTLETH